MVITERKIKKRKWLVFLACTALLISASLLVARAYLNAVTDAKTVRTCLCTVTGKEYRKYQGRQYSYTTELGNQVYKGPGDEEWRIYFRIDDFGAYSDKVRNRLLQMETQRIANGDYRLLLPRQEVYERINVGDKIAASCQYLGDNVVMTWGAREMDDRLNKQP